jgi:flagellar motor switch protein FliG
MQSLIPSGFSAAGDDTRVLGPLDKAAIVLMALDDDRAQQIVSRLDEPELRKVGRAMVTLGQADGIVVEQTIAEFGQALGRSGNLRGGPENAARLLHRALPAAKAAEIMNDITGSGSSDVWAKLAQLQPQTLAGYLLNEAPQAAAVILARLPAPHAAQVFAALPADRIADVASRMVRMEGVHGAVLSDIEETLRREFVGDSSRASGPDSAATLAAVLNCAEKATVELVLNGLEADDAHAASRVRRLMFTFEDLTRVDRATFGTLIAECAADRLPIALSSANPELRELFLSSMSERAGNMLREEIENLPAQRKRVVDDARAEIVALAKRLSEEGRIFILDNDEAAAGAA